MVWRVSCGCLVEVGLIYVHVSLVRVWVCARMCVHACVHLCAGTGEIFHTDKSHFNCMAVVARYSV